MMNLIQLLTDQRAYEGITHSRWGASWNWRWICVCDDEDRRSPSPEPQTDSKFALPMKNRRWQRLRVIKRDESFSRMFVPGHEYMELELMLVERQGAHEAGGTPPPSWTGCGPPDVDFLPVFLIFSKKMFRGVSGHSENFCFCT